MPKFLSIVIGVIAIYETTRAAPNPQRHTILNDNLEDLSLFDIPYELSPRRNTNRESEFTERGKRFFDSLFPQFDFLSRRQSSFASYGGYTSTTKQYNQNKGGGGIDNIFRNPEDFWLNILSTRRPAAVFLPVFVQPIDCGCSGTNQSPDVNNEPTKPFDGGVVTPMNNSTVDLPNRFNDEVTDDDDDGRRPISFKPQQPKKPLSQQPPPFEHGSVQAGLESSLNPDSAPGLSASSQPESTPVTVPSICDGAVVACCLQLNIGNCFERQGCEDTSTYGDPCDPSVVSRVLEKFQRNGELRNTISFYISSFIRTNTRDPKKIVNNKQSFKE